MSKKLNVLFLMADQHNAECIGVTAKRPELRTPHLDRIAENGVRFERAYCNVPICQPSRISFFSGQYAHTHGMLGNHDFHYAGNMPPSLAETFRMHGYQTALVGKSHMIKAWDKKGFEHIRYCDLCDTDRWDILSNHYFKYLVDNGLGDMYEDSSGSLPGVDFDYGKAKLPYKHSHEAWTGDESIKFLQNRDKHRPFFLFTSFERPHPTWLVADEIFDSYSPEEINLPASSADAFERDFAAKPDHIRIMFQDRRKTEAMTRKCLTCHYALITAIDGEIGRILKYLQEQNELENTVIVYTADHGEFAGDHGVIKKNIGIYESIHRIPFLVSAPGIKPTVDFENIIESIDLYPTLCEICGIASPESAEGNSFTPMLAGKKGTKERAICEWGVSDDDRSHAIRTKEWRLVHYRHWRCGELYHTSADPGELNNLWDSPEHQAKKTELLEYLLTEVSHYKLNSDQSSSYARDVKMYGSNSMYQIVRKGEKWSRIKKTHY